MAKALLGRTLSIACAMLIATLVGYNAHFLVNQGKGPAAELSAESTSEDLGISVDTALTAKSVLESEAKNAFALRVKPNSTDLNLVDAGNETGLSVDGITLGSIEAVQQYTGFVVASTDHDVLGKLRELAELGGHSAYVEQYAQLELSIVQLLRQSPELVSQYLGLFAGTDDESLQEPIRLLLAASGSADVQTHALEHIVTADSHSAHKWMQLLSAVGVNSKAHRDQLLEMMGYMQDPVLISTAITAFSPQNIPVDDQEDLLQQLAFYASSDDARVRGASIETLSSWPGEDHTYLIEMGLNDDSEYVRQKATQAAAYSGTRSEVIKNRLLEILGNDGEDPSLRETAHEALQNYSLTAQEKEALYQFFLEFIQPNDFTANAVG